MSIEPEKVINNRKRFKWRLSKNQGIALTICIGAAIISIIQILGSTGIIPSVWTTFISVPIGVFSCAFTLLQIATSSSDTIPSTSSFPDKLIDKPLAPPPNALPSITEQGQKNRQSIATEFVERQENFSEAPTLKNLYGREDQIKIVEKWINDDHCRIVALLGMGGIGKTSLAATIMYTIKNNFDYIYWIKLQNGPEPTMVIRSCIQFISSQQLPPDSLSISKLISILMECLQKYKCLLIFDNAETVLESGSHVGTYREHYEGFGDLLNSIGEIEHRSCLLLTSREKPKEIAILEGKTSPVRTIELHGINISAGQKMLQGSDLSGSPEHFSELVHLYSGNPLALKIVSEPIRELFGGNISEFLKGKEVAVNDLHNLLNQQFQRLSPREQDCMFWLAIEREAVSFDQLSEDIFPPLRRKELISTLTSLRRRSLIEKGVDNSFTLQPVIMEFTIDTFIDKICTEFEDNTIQLFKNNALMKAQAKEYIRLAQIRLILTPLLEQLIKRIGQQELEQKLRNLLVMFRETQPQQSGYIAANIIHLLIQLGSMIHGYDFSYLTIWQAYLQGISLPSINFAYTNFIKPVFTNTFGGILSVAYSPSGNLIAAGTDNGEIRIWQGDTGMPLNTYRGHVNWVYSVTFDPTGTFLLSGGDDQTIRLWQVDTGQIKQVIVGHTNRIRSVSWSADGAMFASGSDDQTVRLWDAHDGHLIRVLQGHTERVRSVRFNIDSSIVAGSSDDHNVLLWDIASGELIQRLSEHTKAVRPISFSQDGRLLATGSDDQQVILWNISTWQIDQILPGHFKRVRSIAFHPDNKTVATSDDQIIRLWNIATGQIMRTFQGHTNPIREIAFSSNGAYLISGGEDQTVRIWDALSGEMLRMFQGHTNPIRSVAVNLTNHTFATGSEDKIVRIWQTDTCTIDITLYGSLDKIWTIAFSPDGRFIASGSEDRTIHIWDISSKKILQVVKGHTGRIRSLVYSIDGHLLISGSEDSTIRVWDVATGHTQRILREHTNRIWSISLHKDNSTLASGSEDPEVYLWDIQKEQPPIKLLGHTNWVRAVSFSPDGTLLASGSRDTTVKIWDYSTHNCLSTLQGHTNDVYCLDFSADGKLLASGSRDQTIRIWDTQTSQCLQVLKGHSGWIYAVRFIGPQLISGSEDGTVKIWDCQTGQCTHTGHNVRPYEDMDITGAKGLSDAQKSILKLLGAVEHSDLPA